MKRTTESKEKKTLESTRVYTYTITDKLTKENSRLKYMNDN